MATRNPPSTGRSSRGATATKPPFAWSGVAGAVFVGAFMLYGWLWLAEGKPVGGALFLVPMLVLFTAPAFVAARRSETGFDLAGLMATGLALRVAAAYYRFANGA